MNHAPQNLTSNGQLATFGLVPGIAEVIWWAPPFVPDFCRMTASQDVEL